MAILSPSGLETADYGMPLWTQIFQANIQKLKTTLLKIEGLLDVDAAGKRDGTPLFWYTAPTSRWRSRLVNR